MATPAKPIPNKPRPTKEVSVMAWIENQFGEVLVLKQRAGRKLWTLPGGKVRRQESLIEALRREVEEETGFAINAPIYCGTFDRPEKDVLTFLYRTSVKGSHDEVKPNKEIAAGKYSSVLPRSSSPSLSYFWKSYRSSSR